MHQAQHGGIHPNEDTDRLQREADAGHEGAREALYDLHLEELARLNGLADDLERQIADLAQYLVDLRAHPFRWDSSEYERYADHLADLRDELDQVHVAIACHLGG